MTTHILTTRPSYLTVGTKLTTLIINEDKKESLSQQRKTTQDSGD